MTGNLILGWLCAFTIAAIVLSTIGLMVVRHNNLRQDRMVFTRTHAAAPEYVVVGYLGSVWSCALRAAVLYVAFWIVKGVF